MLITISGVVGSGKSTTAAAVVNLLAEAGLEPRLVRFRYLRLLGFAKHPKGRSALRAETAETTGPRGEGFSLRRLTVALALGYVARILAFRMSSVGTASQCDVLDRYFYDNLVHYNLTSRLERLYVRVLGRLIPKPDIALLLLAGDRTISTRRRNYAREYVVAVGQQYGQLPKLFPHLVAIHTDSASSASEEIRRVVQALLDREQQR